MLTGSVFEVAAARCCSSNGVWLQMIAKRQPVGSVSDRDCSDEWFLAASDEPGPVGPEVWMVQRHALAKGLEGVTQWLDAALAADLGFADPSSRVVTRRR